MDFVADYEDFGAPEIVVLGIAAIERISESLIRITYYTERKTGRVVQAHLIWDIQRLMEFGWQPFEYLRRALVDHKLESLDIPRRDVHQQH